MAVKIDKLKPKTAQLTKSNSMHSFNHRSLSKYSSVSKSKN